MSQGGEPRHTNRLISESSPYLLQHAHNPVDWFPWGEEALAKARAEDKAIMLSIGYSACHWCHVMERESFEDERIAGLMNRLFVNVKVDREERPDLDAIYMEAVQTMTGRGGWPMTVFLTPDGTPFWGGTYFPPDDRHGMPGFPRVLEALADAWRTRRAEVLGNGQRLRQQLGQTARGLGAEPLDGELLATATRAILSGVDWQKGGFGGAPKFPQPMAIEFLLRQWRRAGDSQARPAAELTLLRMANGGLYDQLGGGFHRYSVDDQWLVPHFEKMLYDNAQLVRAYLMGYQATGSAFFRQVAEQTLEYVVRDMTDPSGGFYSTEDADSEGQEGAFYVWTPAELVSLLGEDDARLFAGYYDVTTGGNFNSEPGKSILHVTATVAEVARRLGVTEERLAAALDRGRATLFRARAERVRPHRDEKIVTAWNGLMLRAVAEAARILDRADLLAVATRNADFLMATMQTGYGRLLRTWKPGHKAKLNGYLEDYANVADGLVAVYEATFQRRWLDRATEIADTMIALFADDAGGFYDTSADHEALIARPKDVFDNATPSGNAVAADVLLRLAILVDRPDFRRQAEAAVAPLAGAMARYPLGFARALSVVDFLLGEPAEIAIIGDPAAADTGALVRTVFAPFVPNKVVAGAAPGDSRGVAGLPLLEERPARDGRATAYVCRGYTCQAPATTPEELLAQLD